MRAPVTHPTGRAGLIGTVVCIGALALVARLASPDRIQATELSNGDRLAEAVEAVRGVVGAHRLSTVTRTTTSGWPYGISPEWFPSGSLPLHPETGRPFLIEVIDGAANLHEPEERTFDRRAAHPRTLWYNRTNGAVAARVVDDGDPMSAIVRFDHANRRSIAEGRAPE